ncbi:MAG: heme exporter protein CcmD [Legionella sp.]|nr:MAG: heme exporter protein CcmD [Legionella sp.]
MNQLTQWLAMGGYAAYVWPAYGLVTAVFMFNLYSLKRQKIRTQKQLRQWFKN